jgi:hypothetical protein
MTVPSRSGWDLVFLPESWPTFVGPTGQVIAADIQKENAHYDLVHG